MYRLWGLGGQCGVSLHVKHPAPHIHLAPPPQKCQRRDYCQCGALCLWRRGGERWGSLITPAPYASPARRGGTVGWPLVCPSRSLLQACHRMLSPGNQSSCDHPQATLKRLLTSPHRREREGLLQPQVRPSLASFPSLPSVCNAAPTTHHLCVLGGARRYRLWKLAQVSLCAALGKPPPMPGSDFGGSAVLGSPRFL